MEGSITAMRILFDHQSFSLQVTGGITRYFHELVRHFNQIEGVSTVTQLGWSTTVWPLKESSKPRGAVTHWGKRLVKSGVLTYAFNDAILSAYNLTQSRVDIYHNTLYRFMPTVRARRHVATHHDCTIERFPHLFPEASIVMRARKKMLKQADLIFCVSNASREDLHEFYDVERSKTVVVTFGPSTLNGSIVAKQELQRLVKRPYVLYVGTRVPYKNFGGLLRGFAAAGLSTDYSLLVIGGGHFSESEKQTIESLNLSSTVVSVPLASGELLAEAYSGAALFVYPSFYEGLGLPPLEAMEKGCKVLVSATPASIEICKDAALFFDPADDQDLADKLRLALDDDDESRRRIRRGYEVYSLYDWKDIAARMIQAYANLL
jgi:glycosyltransferase involved in cell wall biosynthesis